MKKIIIAGFVTACIGLSFGVNAQETLPEKPPPPEKPEKIENKEQQEIVIRSNGKKDVTLKVEITGDKVLINGKPMMEFNSDGVTINSRKMIYRNKNGDMSFNFKGMDDIDGLEGLKDLQVLKDGNWNAYGKGNVTKPFLGVTTEKEGAGAKITSISKGSAAEKAGLKVDDIILKIDKEEVTGADVLAKIIATKKPGDDIKIAYKRDGKNKDLKAALGKRTENTSMVLNYSGPKTRVHSFRSPGMPMPPTPPMNNDFNIDNLINQDTDAMSGAFFPRQKRLGIKIQDTEEGGNVKIIDVEDSSAAQKAGLKRDDVITEINGEKIENTDDAREQLQEVAEKNEYPIKAKRNGTPMDFNIKIPKKLKTANL